MAQKSHPHNTLFLFHQDRKNVTFEKFLYKCWFFTSSYSNWFQLWFHLFVFFFKAEPCVLSLQEICRVQIRRILRDNIKAEYPKMLERKPRPPKPKVMWINNGILFHIVLINYAVDFSKSQKIFSFSYTSTTNLFLRHKLEPVLFNTLFYLRLDQAWSPPTR